MICMTCGEPIQDDPDGSVGVFVHHRRELGDRAFDLDEDHVALPWQSGVGRMNRNPDGQLLTFDEGLTR